MKITPCCDWDVHSSVFKGRLTTCDNTPIISPQDYVDLTSDIETTSWKGPTPDHDQVTGHTPSNETNVGEEIFSDILVDKEKRASSLPPSLRKLCKKNNESIKLGGNEGITTISTTGVQSCTEAPVNSEPGAEHVEIQTASLGSEEAVGAQPGSEHVETQAASASTEAPVNDHLRTEHIERQATPTVTETPVNAQPGTERTERQTTPTAEKEDDSDVEIVEVRPSSTLKRKQSASPIQGPAKKRTKHNGETANSEGKREEAPASDAARAQTLESEDEHESEEESESEGEEDEDSQAAEKLAAASKAFAGACRSCKTNANKALKDKYQREISKLKREHQGERRTCKDKAERTLRNTKHKAAEEKEKMKERHEGDIQDLKLARDTKLSATKKKHDAEILDWQKKHTDDKDKIKELRSELDAAITECKDIEQESKTKILTARRDLEAGERKLREEKKQIVNETRQQIEQLKPTHSNMVKEKDKIIKEMTEHIMDLEEKLKRSDYNLRDFQAESAANRQRYSDCKGQLARTQGESSKAKYDLQDSAKYASSVQKRAETEMARLKAKLEMERENTRQHAERVINLQRQNDLLKDSVQTLSQLGREKREEVQRLQAELRATKAELDIAGDFDVPADLKAMEDA